MPRNARVSAHEKWSFSPQHIGDFVEDLDADGAAGTDDRLGPIRLGGIGRGEIDEDIAVHEASGHSPRPDRT